MRFIRKILCKLGRHSWLAARERCVMEGEAIKLLMIEHECAYCPVVEPVEWSSFGGDGYIDIDKLEPKEIDYFARRN